MDYSFVGDILQYTNILDVIAEVEKKDGTGTLGDGLQRYSNNIWTIPCPLTKHDPSKGPSENGPLTINNSEQTYFCVGCKKYGDVFSFFMDYFKTDFTGAARKIRDYDMSLKERISPETGFLNEDMKTREVLLAAQKYFKQNVSKTLDYLISRGYDENAIDKFNIGYAPDSRQTYGLMNYLIEEGFAIPEMARQGLVKLREGKPLHSINPYDYYETFSNRIIFSVNTASGELSGFSGRIDPEFLKRAENPEKYPKFLNLPDETNFGYPLYRKGRLLYGLDRVLRSIPKPKHVFVMEGYMDVDISQMNNIPAVGNGGTALTEENAKMLSKFFDKIYLVNDMDNAGILATKKAFTVLFDTRSEAKAVVLPDASDSGKNDPADFFIKYKHSADDFNSLKKLDVFDFYSRFSEKETPEQQIKLMEELSFTLGKTTNLTKRLLYTEKLSRLLGVDPLSILYKSMELLASRESLNKEYENSVLTDKRKNVANFLASIMTSKSSSFAKKFIRDVPLEIIPENCDFFPKHLKELYAHLTNQIDDGTDDLLLFRDEDEMDIESLLTDEPKIKGLSNGQMKFDFDVEQRIKAYKAIKTLVDEGILSKYPYEVIGLLREKSGGNIHSYANLVRLHLFKEEQDKLMSEFIVGLSKKDEKASVETLSRIKSLHNII